MTGSNPANLEAAKPSVSAHPAFPAIVALWFAALLGIGFAILPTSLLESVISATGLPAIVAQAAPPLGMTARILLSLAAAAVGAVLGYLFARKLGKASRPAHDGEQANRSQEEPFAASSPRALNVDDLDSERFETPHADDDVPTTPAKDFGRSSAAPARRRALSVTDETGPSEFLYTVPLPGESERSESDRGSFALKHEPEQHDEIAEITNRATDDNPAAPAEHSAQAPENFQDDGSEGEDGEDGALDLMGFASPELESDNEDTTSAHRTLDEFAAAHEDEVVLVKADNQSETRQIFGAPNIAIESSKDFDDVSNSYADDRDVPGESALETEDVPAPFAPPSSNPRPAPGPSETAAQESAHKEASNEPRSFESVQDAPEYAQLDSDKPADSVQSFAKPVENYGVLDDPGVKPALPDTPEAQAETPLAELGMQALLERLGQSLRDNPQARPTSPAPTAPAQTVPAHPVSDERLTDEPLAVLHNLASFEYDDDDDDGNVDLASLDLSLPLQAIRAATSPTEHTPAEPTAPHSDSFAKPAAMIPVGFDQQTEAFDGEWGDDLSGDLSDEADDDGDDNYSSLLAIRNPFADTKPDLVRIDMPEPADDHAQPMVVFPGQGNPSHSLAFDSDIDESGGTPDNTVPFARPGPAAAANGSPRPKLDFAQSEQALRDALAKLQRNQGGG